MIGIIALIGIVGIYFVTYCLMSTASKADRELEILHQLELFEKDEERGIVMKVYHVVTDRPMNVGQKIIFDENNHSGVYERVINKIDVVNEIYKNPKNYKANELEHHTSVALRELAMEEVRKEEYPFYPSRMSCLYVSKTYDEAIRWGEFFARIGRPTYFIVELDVKGNCFIGDATKCFDGQTDKAVNKELAKMYWENPQLEDNKNEVCEMLVDGEITVVAILKEINANI